MIRKQWTTTFREDLRRELNIMAAKNNISANRMAEIAVEYLKNTYCDEAIGDIVKQYKGEN